jgi:hypothetical protein
VSPLSIAGTPGMYRDLVVRKRKTEVDGQLAGLRGPLTARVTELIHSIERGERPVDVANLEQLADYERELRRSLSTQADDQLLQHLTAWFGSGQGDFRPGPAAPPLRGRVVSAGGGRDEA